MSKKPWKKSTFASQYGLSGSGRKNARKKYHQLYYQAKIKPNKPPVSRVPSSNRYRCPLCGMLVYFSNIDRAGSYPLEVKTQTNFWFQGDYLKLNYSTDVGNDIYSEYTDRLIAGVKSLIVALGLTPDDLFNLIDYSISDSPVVSGKLQGSGHFTPSQGARSPVLVMPSSLGFGLSGKLSRSGSFKSSGNFTR